MGDTQKIIITIHALTHVIITFSPPPKLKLLITITHNALTTLLYRWTSMLLWSRTLLIEWFSKTIIDFFVTKRSPLFYETCFTHRHLLVSRNLCVYSLKHVRLSYVITYSMNKHHLIPSCLLLKPTPASRCITYSTVHTALTFPARSLMVHYFTFPQQTQTQQHTNTSSTTYRHKQFSTVVHIISTNSYQVSNLIFHCWYHFSHNNSKCTTAAFQLCGQ